MSTRTFPKVAANQQLSPLDFNRLSDRVEDAVAQVLRTFGFDETLGAYANGLVIRGFEVNQIGLPVNQIRVTAGLAIVPVGAAADADRDDASSGNSAAWRLVQTSSDTIITLSVPGAGTRDDVIEVTRSYTTSLTEGREKRTEGSPDTSASSPHDTLRQATGAVSQVIGNIPSVGAVQVAILQVDTSGFLSYTDARVMLFPTDADSAANESSATFQAASSNLRGALSDIFIRLGKAIHPDGLNEVITCQDGNDAILVDDDGTWASGAITNQIQLDTQDRHIRTHELMHARGFRIRDASDLDQFSPDLDSVCLTYHGGNMLRGKAIVILRKAADGGAVNAANWMGYGISSVTRIDDENYDIIMNGNLFSIGAPFLDGGMITAKAHPHHHCPGYSADAAQLRHFVVSPDPGGLDNSKIRVTCYGTPVGGSPALLASSFFLEIWGPVHPEADGIGTDGVPPSGWTAVS